MLIGHRNNMTLGFTRSKIKVTMVLYVNNGYHSFLRTAYHRTTIFYMLSGLGRIMTPNDFGLTMLKVKVTRVTYKNVYMVFAHCLENCLS